MIAFVDKPRPQERSTSFTISPPSCRKLGRNIWYHSSVQKVSRCLERNTSWITQLKWYRVICNKQPLTWGLKIYQAVQEHPAICSTLFVNNQRLELKPWHADTSSCSSHRYGINIYLICFEMIIFVHLGPCLLKGEGWQENKWGLTDNGYLA